MPSCLYSVITLIRDSETSSDHIERSASVRSQIPMNILPDTRDLINLTERGQPISTDDFRQYLLNGNHQVVLTFNNIRELAGPLAIDGDFLRIRRLLQTVESFPHTYLGEVALPGLELKTAVEAFTSGVEYHDVDPFVTRWDDTINARPGQLNPEYRKLVGLRLDNLVHDVFQFQPRAFQPPHEWVPSVAEKLRLDRDALKAGEATPREHFRRIISPYAASHRVTLPNGREDEFARWIYANPRRCPGLRLNHEAYRQLMMNRDDQFEVGDFVDLNHLFAIPYVEAATLDNRMREYCSRAARRLVRAGLAANYRQRLYRDLAAIMEKNP
jgi:hypothetical protein